MCELNKFHTERCISGFKKRNCKQLIARIQLIVPRKRICRFLHKDVVRKVSSTLRFSQQNLNSKLNLYKCANSAAALKTLTVVWVLSQRPSGPNGVPGVRSASKMIRLRTSSLTLLVRSRVCISAGLFIYWSSDEQPLSLFETNAFSSFQTSAQCSVTPSLGVIYFTGNSTHIENSTVIWIFDWVEIKMLNNHRAQRRYAFTWIISVLLSE